MPKNTTMFIPAGTWTQVNDNDITNITMENRETGTLFFTATATGATAPTSVDGAMRLSARERIVNAALSDLFPGVATPAEIWVYSDEPRNLFVSHA